MNDLRMSSSLLCSPPPLHSWTCSPAGSTGVHACSSSRKEEREGSWKGGREGGAAGNQKGGEEMSNGGGCCCCWTGEVRSVFC